MSGAGGVGAHQDPPSVIARNLGDRPSEHVEVIASVVGVGIARPQTYRK
jgi:hypothetical protein